MLKEKNYEIIIIPFGFQADYIREISNSFASLGNNVFVIGSNYHSNNWYKKGVKFINLRGNDSSDRDNLKKIKDLLIYYYRLFKLISKNNYKVVYDPSIGRPFIIILFYILLKIMDRKIILTVHNILPHNKTNLLNRLSYSIIYKYLANFLIVHTEYLEKKLIDNFKINRSKITLAYHGTYNIDDNKLIDKKLARKMLNINEQEFLVLIFGQQAPYKGTHLFLDKYLPGIDVDIRILIRGYGNPNYIKKLEDIILNSTKRKFIDYSFKYVPSDQVEIIFKACNLVCLPYIEGSQSGVLFMAYAYGKPVLASDVGNFGLDIISGKTGELFLSENIYSFKEKLLKIKNESYLYSENIIKKYAFEKYNWNNFAKVIINNIYSKINNE